MEHISNNPEHLENWIQYFSQANEEFQKKENELEERINTLALVIVNTDEKLEILHIANDELESKIKKINSDIKRPTDQSKFKNITWIQKYELLCDSIIMFIACIASVLFLTFAIPILLTTGGCIFFIHFLARKIDIKQGDLSDAT